MQSELPVDQNKQLELIRGFILFTDYMVKV